MEASFVDSSPRPRLPWLFLACATTALPGCPPTDDYYLTQPQPFEPSGPPSSGTGGQASLFVPECGNGIAEAAEGCDGADLRGNTCESLALGAGTLGCKDCKLDLSGCAAKMPVCGDGIVQDGELCDGRDLRGADCASIGLSGGTLACTASCGFDTSGCSQEARVPVCGDGSAEGSEVCDGLDLRGQSCQGLLGQASGTLRCTIQCVYNASDCTTLVAKCGDNVVQGVEDCDGVDLRGDTCQSLGLGAGELGCTEGCTFDTTGCGATGSECDPQGGAGGAGSMCCMPSAEVCDGRSNDCDDEVDEGSVCPDGCTARLNEGRLYLLCLHPEAAAQRAYADASADCAAAATTLGLSTSLALARIESAAENDFLRGWIQERLGVTPREGMVWNGANDIARETRWVWGQSVNAVQFFQGNYRGGGGTPVMGRFHDFPEGRPNSANETDEDCAGFDSEANWRWNDRLCTQRALGFVCEQADAPDGTPIPPPAGPPGPGGPPWP